MATIHDQIKVLQRKAEELAASEERLDLLRLKAKSDGGRLTQFGKDILLACQNNEFPVGETAKLLGITSSAVSQNAARMRGALSKKLEGK